MRTVDTMPSWVQELLNSPYFDPTDDGIWRNWVDGWNGTYSALRNQLILDPAVSDTLSARAVLLMLVPAFRDFPFYLGAHQSGGKDFSDQTRTTFLDLTHGWASLNPHAPEPVAVIALSLAQHLHDLSRRFGNAYPLLRAGLNNCLHELLAGLPINELAARVCDAYEPFIVSPLAAWPRKNRQYLGAYERIVTDLRIHHTWKYRLDQRVAPKLTHPEVAAEYAEIVASEAAFRSWDDALLARQLERIMDANCYIQPTTASWFSYRLGDDYASLCQQLPGYLLLGSKRELRPGQWTTMAAIGLLEEWRWQFRAHRTLAPIIYRLHAGARSRQALMRWAILQ
jgi:hypothetical protein